MKLNCLLLLVFLSLASSLYGQTGSTSERNSLLERLRHSPEDTAAIMLYLRIGESLEGTAPDSAVYYYLQAGRISDKFNYPAGKVKYIAYHSELLNRQGKYDQSLALNLQAVDIAQKHQLRLPLAKAYANVGVSYQYKAEYEQALQYYLKATAAFEDLKYETGLHMLYSNLCGLYGDELNQYDKAMIYCDKAVALAREQEHIRGLGMAQLNRGLVLIRKKDYAQALTAIQEGYTIGKELSNVYMQLGALGNIIDIYLRNGQYTRVIPVAMEMENLAKSVADVNNESLALNGLASAYLHLKEYQKAKLYASQALKLCRTHELRESLGSSVLQLANIELALGNIEAYDLLRAEGDSLEAVVLNEQVTQNIQELEAKYEAAKKESRIEQLQQENEIQVLSIRQKNILNAVFTGTTVSLLGFGFLFYRNTRNKRIISLQTQELQAQRIKELEQAQQLLAVNAMLKGQEDERSRLARDLHDGLGGMLSGVKLLLSNMKSSMILTERDAASFAMALDQLDNTIRELRRVAHNMMPESLVRFGLVKALQDFCRAFQTEGQLQINFQVFGMEARLEANTEIILYRIVQELLNNVVKHAAATEVLVQIIRTENTVSLTVEDNGRGFDSTRSSKGIGLSNIQSRIDYLGGNIDVYSNPQLGTTVTIEFTLKEGQSTAEVMG
ncbi:ATP-binding protein [Cesiribacter sp. SM1]|uniref:tetratricopeptide repeat-containing sensor histidine kinase n=1 Tax=Cesiribacter sp. SM1 TaxID=2861196 RepID=UPI001CD68D7D|nr:ATP-binding protein [Cesiribacter sp. SM1]